MSTALDACDAFIEKSNINTDSGSWRTSLSKPPQFDFEEGADYQWVLETNVGTIKATLMHQTAPMHVSSTMFLTRLGFYDGLKFHRVITQFMAQGGCPLGSGTGGPGYQYDGEFDPAVKHNRAGLLSMANAGPGTDGSQFFLTFVNTPWLDGKHTIFGQVVEGNDVLVELESRGSQGGSTSEELRIDKATITKL